MTMKLYRFSATWARTETIGGIFAAEEADVKAAYGLRCYLEEPCGRHSSGEFALDPKHIKVLTDDAAFIAKATKYGLLPTGINPLSAITCDSCGDALRPPYEACHHKGCGGKRA